MSRSRAVVATLFAIACSDAVIPVNPTAVSVRISRDSAYVEVGDTIALRAESRDLAGSLMVSEAPAWNLLDPSLVTLGVSGFSVLVTGTSPGMARLVAVAGRAGDTAVVIVRDPVIETTLDVHLDTIDAIGGSLAVPFQARAVSGPRSGRYQVTSRNTLVAVASLAEGPRVVIDARASGAAWVAVNERRGSGDSVLVVVSQRPESLSLVDTIAGLPGHTRQLSPVVRDRLGAAVTGLTTSYESRDAAVATVTAGGLVTFVGAGRCFVTASLASGPRDSVFVTVLPAPRFRIRSENDRAEWGRTASGLRSQGLQVDLPDATTFVHLTVRDHAIATAPDSLFTSSGFTVIGKQPGTTFLVAESPHFLPDSIQIVTLSSRIRMLALDQEETRRVPLVSGTNGRFLIRFEDVTGRVLQAAAPVLISIHSTNPSVIAVPGMPDPYVFNPDKYPPDVLTAMPAGPGEAWVVASSPGFAPDSLLFVVGSMPSLVFLGGPTVTLGVGQVAAGNSPAISSSYGGNAHPDIPVAFTQLHPSVSEIPTTASIPTAASSTPFLPAALGVGRDTVIATATGFLPDTLFIQATTPRILVADTATVVASGALIPIALGDTTGAPHSVTSIVTIQVTSADTSVAGTGSARIYPGYGRKDFLGIDARDTGVATLSLGVPGGVYPPATSTIHIVLDTTLQATAASVPVLSPLQVIQGTGINISSARFRDTVYLTSTNPAVISVDPFLPPDERPAGLALTAGEQTGSARIVARSRGYVPDTSDVLTVSPGRLRLSAPARAIVSGTDYTAAITVRNAADGTLPLSTSVALALVPLDGGIDGGGTVVIPEGSSSAGPLPLVFTKPGVQRLAVEDRRPVPFPYKADTVSILVELPQLTVTGGTTTVGQRMLGIISRTENARSDGLNVAVRSLAGRTGPSAVNLGAGTILTTYQVNGVSPGLDTLVFEAVGYLPDSAIVSVTDGNVFLSHWPGTLRTGTPVTLQLLLADSAGATATASEPTTFQIVSDGPISFSNATGPITSITVPAGSYVSPSFSVTAVFSAAPVETARVRFLNLNYRERTWTTSATP